MNRFKWRWNNWQKYRPTPLAPESGSFPELNFASFHEVAGRPSQQDALLLRPDKGLFIVCDGVGGAPCGEVAAQLAVEGFNAFLNISGKSALDASSIRQGGQYVRRKFTEFTKNTPKAKGMATTLAMIALNGRQVCCAHMGDSRIYHISTRRKNCLWHSTDHSVVQEMFDQGSLKTQEEMTNHPMRRHITRAIGATQHPSEPDITSRNLEDGDILFVCSDGVLEPFSTDELVQLLCREQDSLAAALAAIKVRCLAESTDNCTCIVVQVFF